MTKNTFLLLLFLVSICSSGYSQTANNDAKTDSLRKELNDKKGSDKIAAQLELASLIIEKNTPDAQSLAREALQASKILRNKSLEMRAYLTLGKAIQVSDNIDLSAAYYDSALTIAETTGDNWYKAEILFRKGLIEHRLRKEINALEDFNDAIQAARLSNNYQTMASTYSLMGTIFRINGLYDRAIEYIINSKLNYEKAGSADGKAWSAYLLGRIYADLKLREKALEYFQEALKIYGRLASMDGNKTGVAICYEQIGLLNLESGNFGEAHQYIDSTLEMYAADKSGYGLSSAHKNLGMIEYAMGNYDQAEKYLNQSLNAKEEINDQLSLPTIYEYLGLCMLGQNQTKEGFESLQKALKLATANNQKKIQLNIYAKLAEAYLRNNDLKNAINCQKQQIKIQSSLLSGEADIKIEQLQAIYEIDKQNRQIVELEKQNEINSLTIRQHRIAQTIMVIGILIAFLVSVSIYWFYNKIRRKNLELKETNAAKDKLFAIIAHDLRGPTSNLTAFLEHVNDTFGQLSPEQLKKILSSLYKSAENVSILLENLLIWARSQLNKIEFNPTEFKLTDVLKTSIKSMKQVADNKQIDVKFELDDQISVLADPDMVQTIMRNIVSNAIKFTYRRGSIIVKSFAKDSNNATISVIDNGVGIEKSALSKIFDISGSYHTNGTENEMSTGLGLILVKDFVEKNKGTLTVESRKGEGTTVSFTLPIAHES